jgi:flavin-dependent thymidylate synthase
MNSNSVELLGTYGGDIEHACSAWQSTDRTLTPEKRERIPAMLATLAKDGHHTPFEKSSLHFTITTDIATHIHFLKHRIGVSINAESARYKQIKEDRVYIPCDWPIEWQQKLIDYSTQGLELYHQAMEALTPKLGRKRTKESARFFRGYNTQIQSDVMFNFRSFMHFQKLRNDDHAQDEIHGIARIMISLVKQVDGNPFEHSLKAFGY